MDGPAIEKADGRKEWYLLGEKMTKEKFDTRVRKIGDTYVGKIVKKVHRTKINLAF